MKHFLSYLILALLFASCSSSSQENTQQENIPSGPAKGGVYYGGEFHLNESEYIKSLYPLSIADVYSYRVACQIYEGLFKFDPATLEVVNGLAESYTLDSTRTIYTIKLRKGVRFHDDPCFPDGKGREVKAQDVAYCFQRVCTQSSNNQGFTIFKDLLKGANEYYAASAGGNTPSFDIAGIKVIDDYTIQLQLTRPYAFFLYNLARPFAFIYPREAVEKYGEDGLREKAVGTGPFFLASIDPGNAILLKRNPHYYMKDEHGNQLPYLHGIKISFIREKKTEYNEFRAGKLDMVYRLPTERIIDFLMEAEKSENGEVQDFILDRVPEMATQYLTFMTAKGVFQNKNLRKAFNFAIDREKILEFVLNGEGEAPGHHGIVPPVFKNYDINKIRGYQLNIDSAQYYLAKAGYPNGNGFPEITLQVNAEGDRHLNVALEIQKQLQENLNIKINIETLPFAQLLENSLQGKFDLVRTAYFADYPNPENFLWLFTGMEVPDSFEEKSYPNIARYKNPRYDELYNKALLASTPEEAYRYLQQAEQILLDDAVILVLWYDEAYRLTQPYVRNFPNNPIQYRDFTKVYFDKSYFEKQNAKK
ncbi:ABC transporter substrate-binding protein [Thermonema rossianum]|uniref:ABC transporter substrate-binding protein n=1 Tax=Thermonema rossianum TaxID=55505 RepID=UPI00057208BB|nr:peptide ABC transporter substrate-binding protein [Thermonema rossianum]